MPEPLSDEIKAAIKKEALSQSAKWVIGGGAVLVALAALGWWYALAPRLSAELGVLPEGAVVAFHHEAGCPRDWRPYEPAAGRVIIGVRDKAHDNLPLREWRETGGTQFFLSQAPLERADSEEGGVLYKRGGYGDQIGLQARGGDAFAVMPPYVVVHYCMKTNGPEFRG